MTIKTRDFGSMELDEQQVVEFLSPIYGFEGLKRFVVLSDDETGDGLLWLQSVERSDVCFILLDPEEMGFAYSPELSPEVSELLQMDKPPALRLIAMVPEDFSKATVNLKSPIVINQAKKLAAQVLLDADYPIRMPLFDSEEASEC